MQMNLLNQIEVRTSEALKPGEILMVPSNAEKPDPEDVVKVNLGKVLDQMTRWPEREKH